MMGFLKFKDMVTLGIIRLIYPLGVLIISFASFGVAFIDNERVGGFFLIVIGNLVWRLLCEALVVQFRIHEALTSLDKKTPPTP